MGGFGAPDRGGSREGKKSLRGNKQSIAKKVKDEQRGHVNTGPRPTVSEPPPAALPLPADPPGVHSLVDCAAQLLNRQFDRDQFKVLQRAQTSGVGPIVAYTTDFEKVDLLVRCAKENAGLVYCMVGVHTDNIKRNNEKLSAARLDQLKDLALRSETVALMAGLDYSRDMSIRYAQERALMEQMELAAGVALPLMLYEVRAADVLVERLVEFRASGAGSGRAAETPVAIFNFTGSGEELQAFLSHGCHIVLTGRVCEQTERGERLRALAATVPKDKLLLASDAPFATPQNIADVFVREGRNEPSNLPSVAEALAPALGMPVSELSALVRANAMAFFGIKEAAEAEAAAAEAAEAAAAAAAADPAGASCSAGTGDDKCAAVAGLRPGAAAVGDDGEDAAEEEQQEDDKEGSSGSGQDEDEQEEVGQQQQPVQAHRRKQQQQAAKAANRFAMMALDEEQAEGEDEGSAGQSHSGGEGEEEGEQAGRGAGAAEQATTSGRGAGADAGARGGKPPPRNFVAEYEAAAAARGPAAGPRVSYACRSCRSVLFSEASVVLHADADELDRVDFKQQRRKAGGRKGRAKDHEGGLCSMHFLADPLGWMQSQLADVGEGKLVCPTCAAKLGKWACGGGPAVAGGGIQCSCGVVVPAPAYAVQKARLDIIDAQLDISSAVASTLQAYEEEQDGSDGGGSSSDDGEGRRKKRGKQKRNKTANFSSFRNKAYGVNLKQLKQQQEPVVEEGN